MSCGRARRGLTLALGELIVELAAGDGAWHAALAPRYGAFASRRRPRFRIRLEGRAGPVGPSDIARFARESVEVESAGRRLTLRSTSVAAEVDLESGEGWLAAPVHRQGVDLLLRLLITAGCDDALLLHGALALDGGRAWIGAGPSGAGKSTLASLLGERAYCDELTLARRTPSGWTAHALPYWHGRPGSGRLARICLLRHGDRHQRRALDAAEARRRLAAEVIWPAHSAAACERALGLFARLLDEVAVDELSFRPTADVWPALVGAAA